MFITELNLSNFRNYESLSIELSPKVTIFYGDNAQGKTNILEAIYLSATTKSHKSSKDKEIIRFGKEEAHIRTYVEKEDVESVTIIEKEQSVIDLFNEVILPSIPHGDKITVIKSDASEYLSSIDDGLYDYCFADTWTGTEDIEAYFAVKEAAKKFRKMKTSYRIRHFSFSTIRK